MRNEANKDLHVAIIMDGNRRWEKSNSLSFGSGHKAGLKNALSILESAAELSIGYISFFVFSAENWSRSKAEVELLLELISFVLENYKERMLQLGAKVSFIGDINSMPNKIKNEINDFIEVTKDCTAINVQIALNYGGRQEIISAINSIMLDCQKKNIIIDQNNLKNYMQSKFPDPDLIIRTSGEKRLSNFLLWQSAYSELYFSDKLWPDFDQEDLMLAIKDYYNRKRNYGS